MKTFFGNGSIFNFSMLNRHMELNGKDFIISLILSIFLFFSAAIILQINPNIIQSYWMILFLVFLIPGFFYFYRNRLGIKDAVVISSFYAFSFSFIISLILLALNSIFLGLGEAQKVNWVDGIQIMFFTVVINGLGLMVPTILSYFIAKFFRNKIP